MRVHADLLSDAEWIELAPSAARLWCGRLDWTCREVPVRLRVLCDQPLDLPAPEFSEPPASAIARVIKHVANQGALVLLENPARALGAERIAFAEGVRLFGIATDGDVAAWDAMLSIGQPVYGVRGRLTLELDRPSALSAISALAYGLFTCDEGLSLDGLHEDRAGIGYVAPVATTASVIIRDGFEAGILTGAAGATVHRPDAGNETVIRLVISDGAGHTVWTQPRFVGRRG